MEIISDLKLISLVGDFKNNVEVAVDSSKLEIRIDKKHLFTTLKYRKEIVGLLNKKLDGLVEGHISEMAKKQEEINEDL